MPRADPSHKRCAIYTRKSSEEGLEQEFNSVQAQREACEAYIRSQRHEGWALASYDDAGSPGQYGAARSATPAGRYPSRSDRYRGRLQGRPAHPVARRFCAGGGDLRRTGRAVRVGDPAIHAKGAAGTAASVVGVDHRCSGSGSAFRVYCWVTDTNRTPCASKIPTTRAKSASDRVSRSTL